MNCTTSVHIWLWFGAGTGSACDDHVRCQCGAYTYGEWHSLRNENARLRGLLAERDAEIVRLVDAGRALADALSAFSVDVGALPEVRQYRLTHLDADPDPDYPVTVMHPWGDYRVVDDRLEDWYAALAARGGEVQS